LTATYSAGSGTFTATSIQDHSSVMGGTFTLTLDGTPIKIWNTADNKYSLTDIPFNVDKYALRNAFRQLPGLALT
jgi:hypothetical protein